MTSLSVTVCFRIAGQIILQFTITKLISCLSFINFNELFMYEINGNTLCAGLYIIDFIRNYLCMMILPALYVV